MNHGGQIPGNGGVAAHEISPTEQRLEESMNLDELSIVEVLRLLNKHDAVALRAVEACIDELAEVVAVAAERFQRGGNVHYFGAGTSGRLGVLDAAELVPTFNIDTTRVVAHIAGGTRALVQAVEDAEYSMSEGAAEAQEVGERDIAIGLAASGNTPYVRGALKQARANGAYTVLVSCNPYAGIAGFVH